MGKLQSKDYCGERHAHCAAEYGPHTDEWPKPDTLTWKEHGFHSTERSPNHQKRSQYSARSSRPKCKRPDCRFDHKDSDDDCPRDIASNQIGNRFVTHTQRLGKNHSTHADHQTADQATTSS